LATFEQKLNETSACSVPVDEDANSEESCQSEDEMNVSITSWDMVGDSDEATRENCAPGLVAGIESEVKDQSTTFKPHESEACHTLKEKEQSSCCDTAPCVEKEECEQDCC